MSEKEATKKSFASTGNDKKYDVRGRKKKETTCVI